MWVFNIWLYICFMFGGLQYQERVADGAPCYVYIESLGDMGGDQPVCFYDPTNTNPGKLLP